MYFVVPSEVQSLAMIPVNATALNVSWKAPVSPNGIVRHYRVMYRVCSSAFCASEHTRTHIHTDSLSL
jgi:hypothetical protein